MHTTRKRSTKANRRSAAVLMTKDARGDSAATKRDAQSEFERAAMQPERDRHIRAIESNTADVNGTSSQATPSEAWWRTRSIVTRRSSGRRCGLERWRGNELNTELGARYSTRWLRSGCPIRTAPGDSATGTGRSAICSGPCNNAHLPPESTRRASASDQEGNASRGKCIPFASERVSALRVRSMGPSVEEEACSR